MTQQTTPRKTVEMVARECAESVLLHLPITGLTNHDFEEAAETINQAISDAVKGSGAVEALEVLTTWAPVSGIPGHVWKPVVTSLTALRALTLPEQPTK